jgi:tetratricopeptide (TPR) repeat protein
MREALQDLSRAYNINLAQLAGLLGPAGEPFVRNAYSTLKDHLDAGIAAQPNAADFAYHRALIWAIQGIDERALSDFERTIALDRTEPRFHFARGLLQLHRERFAEALKDFQATLKITPQHAAAYREAGRALLYQGSADQALECLNTSIGIVANHPRSFFDRAMVYELLGNPRAARTDYEQSLRLGGMDLQALERLLALSKELGPRGVDRDLPAAAEFVRGAYTRLVGIPKPQGPVAADSYAPVIVEVLPEPAVVVVAAREPEPQVVPSPPPPPALTMSSDRPSLFGAPGQGMRGLGTLGSHATGALGQPKPAPSAETAISSELAHVVPQDAEDWCLLAEDALKSKAFDEALSAINAAIAADQRAGKFYWVRARVLEAKGERFQAIADDQRASSHGFRPSP